jgi:hypothetical protein
MFEKLLVGLIGLGAVASIAVAGAFGLIASGVSAPATGGGGMSVKAEACTVSTVANVQLGAGTGAQTVLAASGRRAWARISQVQNSAAIATSTPFLSFNAGAAALVNSGVTLGTTTPSIDFGLATDFPYTGAVTGIIGNGGASTTVQVTQCLY